MTLDEYQTLASTTAIYPGRGSYLGLMYLAGKLNGEAGEVAEEVFKGLRDDKVVEHFEIIDYNPVIPVDAAKVCLGFIDMDRRNRLKKELGDALWYISQTARELGFQLSEVAGDNVHKLKDRQQRGVLQGSGSDR